jgi:hypothetical protein
VRPHASVVLGLLLGSLAVGACGGPSSSTTVVVTPAAPASSAGPSEVPADDKTMVVHVGDTTIRYVTGSAEATSAIMSGVRHARSAAIACYDAGATKNRGLRGGIIVQLLLSPSGAIRSVENGGSAIADREVVECVLHAFRSTSFADLDGHCTGDVAVTEPLTFEPRTAP